MPHDENTRWAVPSEGALVSYTYRGFQDRIKDNFGHVHDLRRESDGTVVASVRHDGTAATLRYDPADQDGFGVVSFEDPDFEEELLRVRQVIPPSQVRTPGVDPGDYVKIRTGSSAYRVEDVNHGLLTLEDGRTVPVTQVGAFDEDIGDDERNPLANDPFINTLREFMDQGDR